MGNLTDIGYGIGKYLDVSDASGIPDIESNRRSLNELDFKIATNNAYKLYNFKDGVIDAYQSEDGIDATASTNETYDSTSKSYGPTGGNTNMTLVSTRQEAVEEPDYGRIQIYEEDISTTVTPNTDIKAYVSRNDGGAWEEITLTNTGYMFSDRGIDTYTKLLLHMDGAAAGTTFVDSSLVPKTVSRNSDVTTYTLLRKFDTGAEPASGYFTGTGSYPTGNLTVANDSDFNFTGDFTIDFWLRFPDDAASLKNQKICGCSLVSGSWVGWHIKKDNTSLRLNWEGSSFNTQFSSDVPIETWTHVAVVRSGSTTKGYLDGVEKMSLSQSGTIASGGYDFAVGAEHNDANWDYPKMNMDELRISNGIARWTSAFTPPAAPYKGQDRLLTGTVDISGQSSGTYMKYKIETLNNKNLKLHGTSLLWA